ALDAPNGYPDAQTQHAEQNSTPGYDGHMDMDPIALAQSALESSVTHRPQNAYAYMFPYRSFFPPAPIPAHPHQQHRQHYQPPPQQHPPQRPQSAVPTGFRGHHPSTMSSQAPIPAMSYPSPHPQSVFARPAP